MPARDRYHDQVRHALIKDGWTITHDPLRLQWGVKDMYVEPDRILYLAVNEEIFIDLFEEPIGKLLIANGRVRLLVFDPQQEVIRQWTPTTPIAN